MTATMDLKGFDATDGILEQLPILLRGKYLSTAMQQAMATITADMEQLSPRPGASVGGIPYTIPRGRRASTDRLYKSIRQVVRKYNSDNVLAVIGGPSGAVKGHHHLVEFGFHHTSGGTFAGSGRKARTRRAQQQVGVRLTRLIQRGGKQSAANMSGSSRVIAGGRFSRKRLEGLKSKYMTQRLFATAEGKSGAGKRGAFVPGRSYVTTAFNRHKDAVQNEIIAALQRFVEELKNKKNPAT